MGRLHDLYTEQGQSPWLDNLKRGWITSGELERWVDRGIRGITSNPTIFQRAIENEEAYDEQFQELINQGNSIEESYWELVSHDIARALDILRPVFDASDGLDGFVSVEVSPALAHDTAGTVAAARDLHERIASPNLYVKIPATPEGLPAIEQLISEGCNVNVTLLFSTTRYAEVIDAYLRGLERLADRGGDPSTVSSVASFFVSRVDTETDRRLEAVGTPDALELRGKAAIANAKLAYQLFLERFSGDRWARLAARGARVQRPLWASTSTKNPTYPDTIYVDELIGPDTVNTMPDHTLGAFEDHGTITRTLDRDVDAARDTMKQLAAVGVDFSDVTKVLEDEGVAAFAKSFDDALNALQQKADVLQP
ncbi:MAG: transaldolase [Acidimicrobiales bacterium]|nr:transaldolase [Acidimicrobiales bacterium]